MSAKYDPYLVYRDTREKDGWEFTQSGYCAGTQEQTIKTGDYTLYGYENHICIERKGNVSELATNITLPAYKRKYMKVRGPFFLKRILELQKKYDVPFVFCGKYAKEVCSSIFKRFMESQSKYDNKK